MQALHRLAIKAIMTGATCMLSKTGRMFGDEAEPVRHT